MSMLAERKRKQKWSLNPRGKDWAEDSNKFGQKLLEKMGWQHGKGLGAKEDGITEHVKVSYKNDSKGMGYKESNDQWTEHESQFSALLASLSGNENKQKNNDPKLGSLEQKSQLSRARVHYHKFTRGKDLSRYSEKDLANIFGKKSLKDTHKKETPIQKEDSKEDLNCEESNSKFLINAGSMKDYFKKKLTNFGKNDHGYVIGSNGVLQKEESDESESELRPSFGFGFNVNNNNEAKSGSEIDKEKLKNKSSFVSYIQEKRKFEDVDNVFSPRKKVKKDTSKGGVSNPAFNPMSTPIKVDKHILDTIEENLTEDVDNGTEAIKEVENVEINTSSNTKQKSRKSKECGNEYNNPTFSVDLDSENPNEGLDMEKNPFEVIVKVKKSKKNKLNEEKRLCKDDSEINENKVSKRKKKNTEVYENKGLDDNDAADNNIVEIVENPYEVKTKGKKKMQTENETSTIIDNNTQKESLYKKSKKKSKKILTAVDNTAFKEESEEISMDNINPYEVKLKKKKKNSNNSGIVNPALNLNDTNIQDEESTILEECDLMLNIISTPTTVEENLNKQNSLRKTVRFSNVNQELIIPNNEELKTIYGKERKNKNKNKNGGLDNINFNKDNNIIEENIETISKKLDNYQAEIENDINEEKIIMVGEVGNPHGENEQLTDGSKLKFKYANLEAKTPFYQLDKVGPRKSYKHLIKGDIVVKFKNSNLHEINGYGVKVKR